MSTDTLTIGIAEPSEQYHARSGVWLSSHLLAKFIKSPALYWSTIHGDKEPDTPAYAFGRAFHVWVLEGEDRFREEFAFDSPINPKTQKPFGDGTKAFDAWAAEQTKTPLNLCHVSTIKAMDANIRRHHGICEILSSGQPERVIRREYQGMKCQIRMDWFNGDLTDLKSCWDLDFFQDDFRQYNYPTQLAFYEAILSEELNSRPQVSVIASEKNNTHRCGAWRIDRKILDTARRENELAIAKLKLCIERNHFPMTLEEV